MTDEASLQEAKVLREKVRKVHRLLADLKAPFYYIRHYPTLAEKLGHLLEETGAKSPRQE